MGICAARTTTTSEGHNVLHLSRTLAPLAGFATPVIVRTSAGLKNGNLRALSAEARKVHTERAELGGAQKGRLLYVASGKIVLAFLGVHVPPSPGPIICEAFAAVETASDEQQSLMRAHLLAAAEELSVEALGRKGKNGNIAWATKDVVFRSFLRDLGFKSTAKPQHSDCNRPHYLEGSFS